MGVITYFSVELENPGFSPVGPNDHRFKIRSREVTDSGLLAMRKRLYFGARSSLMHS